MTTEFAAPHAHQGFGQTLEAHWAGSFRDIALQCPVGLVMTCKRLEETTFTWPAIRDGLMTLNHARFEALSAGLDWRKALFGFFILTGSRDGAVASLRLEDVDLGEADVFQDGRGVDTKYSKRVDTRFFPVDPALRTGFSRWGLYLEEIRLSGWRAPRFRNSW